MGEAKKRGTFEQRKAAAVERNIIKKLERLANENQQRNGTRIDEGQRTLITGTIGHTRRSPVSRRLLMASVGSLIIDRRQR